MKKYTNDYISNFFKENGCELLSIYSDARSKVDYKCSCGNISKTSWDVFRKGHRCHECMKNRLSEKFRFTYEYVKKYFEENNCELLEGKYKNKETPLKYKCSCGRISKISFGSFRCGRRCVDCGGRKKLTYEYVKNYFEKFDCELLDKKYVNCETPLNYKCSCGTQTKIRFSNFKNGNRCKNCGYEKIRIAQFGKNSCNWNPDRLGLLAYKEIKMKCYTILYNLRLSKLYNIVNDILGYSGKELNEYIISHSNWSRVKDGKWHLDHIFPISAFVKNKIYDLKLINCLDNLQPLSRKENLQKSNKYNSIEFQEWLIKRLA